MRRQFFGSAPGALRRVLGMKAWRTSEEGRWVPSLRHVSLRETGWSRNPTSSGRTRPGSKGKATHGEEVRIYAFPRYELVERPSALASQRKRVDTWRKLTRGRQ